VLVYVINSLHNKLRNLAIPAGNITIIVVSSILTTKDILVPMFADLVVSKTRLAIKVGETPFGDCPW
jgi:hypothetical protein